MTFKVNVKRSTLSGISTTTTTIMMEVLVSCTDAPVCSSAHVSNTGSAWQYILMKFTLQESECLRTSNREATSPGRARFDVVTAMLAEDFGSSCCERRCGSVRAVAGLSEALPSFETSAVTRLLLGATSKPTLTSEVFTAVASARLNVEPVTLKADSHIAFHAYAAPLPFPCLSPAMPCR